MPRHRNVGFVLAALVVVAAACGPAPATSVTSPPTGAPSVPTAAAPSAAATAPASPSTAAATELTAGAGTLPAGTYTRSSFPPPIVFAVDAGWTAGNVVSGFFDVQQEAGTPDVIAVQFADVDGVAGQGASIAPASTSTAAIAAIRENPSLVVVDESASRMSGLDGLNVIVENRGAAPAVVMRVAAGALSIDPGRKLWISLFDTPDGLLAVMVGGSIAHWERTLTVAEPVLESVLIGDPDGPSPAAGVEGMATVRE
jgi:hypothetical protein